MAFDPQPLDWHSYGELEHAADPRAEAEDGDSFLAPLVAAAMVWGAILGGAIGFVIGRNPL